MRDRLLTMISGIWTSVRSNWRRTGVVAVAIILLVLLVSRYQWHRRTGNPFLPVSVSSSICRIHLSDLYICRIGRIKVSPKPTPLPTPTPTPTPTPKPIPHGKQTFTVSSGKKTGPQFTSGIIDPYDPKRGSEQVFSVTLTGANVTTVSLTLTTDTRSRRIPMKLTGGTWIGSWTVDDTYLYTYLATFTASDGVEENKVELTLR